MIRPARRPELQPDSQRGGLGGRLANRAGGAPAGSRGLLSILLMAAVGIILALGAAVANAFAVVLQAAEARNTPPGEAARLSLLVRLAHRRRWLAGTGLLVMAWPLQVLALLYAPITVVQPTLAFGQLVLLAVARVRLRERVGLLELAGALAVVAGIGLVIWAAPRHTVQEPGTLRVSLPLVLVGMAALAAFGLGRRRPGGALLFVIGAGLAYAWVDFANKLLANALSDSHWSPAAAWLTAILAFGALAFLEETTSLQQRPAVTVAPVIGAVHDPLPVLMALAAGVESWGPGSHQLVPLALGLAIVTAGAATLGRSRAVARVSAPGLPPQRPGSMSPTWGLTSTTSRRRSSPQPPEPSPGCARR